MPPSWPPDGPEPDSQVPAPVVDDASAQPPILGDADDDLPVVARMVVEIRSDGRRTVARGALEDPDGTRVSMEAHSTTPWALARELAKALWTIPRLRRPSLRSLLPGRRRRDD